MNVCTNYTPHAHLTTYLGKAIATTLILSYSVYHESV